MNFFCAPESFGADKRRTAVAGINLSVFLRLRNDIVDFSPLTFNDIVPRGYDYNKPHDLGKGIKQNISFQLTISVLFIQESLSL